MKRVHESHDPEWHARWRERHADGIARAQLKRLCVAPVRKPPERVTRSGYLMPLAKSSSPAPTTKGPWPTWASLVSGPFRPERALVRA